MPRRRTALIVAVPEAERLVSELRLAYDSSAALGVPAHITILFPFAPPKEIDEHALADVIARQPAFAFELTSVERFGAEITYLAPEPSGPFTALTRMVEERWPEYPPYEGAHEVVVPHLTVGERMLDLSPPLPIACHAHDVVLLEEDEPGGRWQERRRFPLGQR
jgi:2'-5' RNA ligase